MEEDPESEVPNPLDLFSFLPYACGQMQAPFELQIIPYTHFEPPQPRRRSRRSSSAMRSSAASAASTCWRRGSINILVVQDLLGHVLELIFWRCKMIPSLLLKIISLCIPFHTYLTKVSVRWGPSRGFGLKEIVKFLPESYLTEICLDDTPIPQRNVHALLEARTPLRRLSLARCGLGDEACALLAARLHYPLPAAYTLAVLTLSSNAIAEPGAAALAAALRTNRALLHLDLADNALSAAAAAHILRTLGHFPLSEDEVLDRNRRYFEYLKLRDELIPLQQKTVSKTISKIDKKRTTRTTVRRTTRKVSPDADKENVVPLKSKLKMGSTSTSRTTNRSVLASVPSSRSLSEEETLSSVTVRSSWPGVGSVPDARRAALLQLKRDPLSKHKTFGRNGAVFSLGNMKLASLNLAYNRLDCSSVVLLCRVLAQQAVWRETRAPALSPSEESGLVRVRLDGNPMPQENAETRRLQELLQCALGALEDSSVRFKPSNKNARKH